MSRRVSHITEATYDFHIDTSLWRLWTRQSALRHRLYKDIATSFLIVFEMAIFQSVAVHWSWVLHWSMKAMFESSQESYSPFWKSLIQSSSKAWLQRSLLQLKDLRLIKDGISIPCCVCWSWLEDMCVKKCLLDSFVSLLKLLNCTNTLFKNYTQHWSKISPR